MAFGMSACAGQQERPVDWHDRDSYSGWVTDARTGEPIEGAVIVAKWQILQRHPLHSRTDQIIRLEEILTDKEGRFQFAPLGHYEPPLGWERDEGAFPHLAFFKPGYEPTGQQRFTWEFGQEARLAPNLRSVPLKKEGWKREIQLYEYLTRPSTSGVIDPSIKSTPEEKILDRLTSFASNLDRNVRLFEGSKRREREAVEAQWRAIVMIDNEIRKYEPKYQWLNSAIQDALRVNRKEAK
jgi:hypothetical protein